MTGDVVQVITDLTAWPPVLAALITQPDTQPCERRSQPSSRPPWNSAVANAWLDIHALARTAEADLRYAVTGTLMIRGGSDGNTIEALRSAARFAPAAPDWLVEAVTADFERALSAVLQLAAVDLEQPPQALSAPCPRPGCHRPMLRWYPARRELACLGCAVKADIWDGPVSGQPVLKWQDGIIT